MNKYQIVIGLEIHAAVLTNSKVFSPSKNDYSLIPNDNVNEIDLSFPGIMPYVNKEAVRKALKMSIILGCTQPDVLTFDRKNYYYPDLPKGFQITQVRKPVGVNGNVELYADDHLFNVSIHDIHLEEDTASMDHYDFYSLIDYNRSGTPLVEIVTDPCLHSGEEAAAFLEFLVNSLRYANISDADMKKGHMRCDVNINLKNEEGEYITPKVEIKNIGSISYVKEAVDYEVDRQIKALESNCEELVQETRRFDEDTKTTIRMRVKENSVDYKYMPEPNIPDVKISLELLDEIKKEIPVLPNVRLKKYITECNLLEKEAKTIVRDYDISEYYEECLRLNINPKEAFNWLSSNIIGYLNKEHLLIKDFFITPSRLKDIIDNVNDGTISSKQAKELFFLMIEENDEASNLITKHNLKQMTNNNELEDIISNILNNNPSLIEEYHNGRSNIFDYFVGQVMKETRGKANPVLVKQILNDKLK